MKPMDVVYQCLLESEGDIEAGLMAADIILSNDESPSLPPLLSGLPPALDAYESDGGRLLYNFVDGYRLSLTDMITEKLITSTTEVNPDSCHTKATAVAGTSASEVLTKIRCKLSKGEKDHEKVKWEIVDDTKRDVDNLLRAVTQTGVTTHLASPLSIKLSLQPMSLFSVDEHGREHKGKGPGGGQFVAIPDRESGIPKRKLFSGWTKAITIPVENIGKVSKFIWNNVSKILDNIPGSKAIRKKAKRLTDGLRERYGDIGLLSIIGTGLAIHYRRSLFTGIEFIAPSVIKGATTVISAVSSALPVISKIIGTNIPPIIKAITGSSITSAIVPPSLTILGVLAAAEVYKLLRRSPATRKGIIVSAKKAKSIFGNFLYKLDYRNSALSIDSHGKEHAPAGTSKGGQFVKQGRSKHERLEKSAFTYQSQLSEDKLKELDNLTKELDGKSSRIPITISINKISEWKASVENKATELIDKIPGGIKVREKLKSIKESLTSRYGVKTMTAIVTSGITLSWSAVGAIAATGNPALAAATFAIPSPVLMLPALALAELRHQISKPKGVVASVDETLSEEEIERIAKKVVKDLTKVSEEVSKLNEGIDIELSTDSHGKEHAPAGTKQGGQFVKRGIVGKTVDLVTAPVKLPFKLMYRSSRVAYTAGIAAVREVAEKAGGKKHAERVGDICAVVDGINRLLGVLTLQPVVIPLASQLYLMYSSVRRPITTFIAGARSIGPAWRYMLTGEEDERGKTNLILLSTESTKPVLSHDEIRLILSRLEEVSSPDWYTAQFINAMIQTKSVEKAIKLTDIANKIQPSPPKSSDEEEREAVTSLKEKLTKLGMEGEDEQPIYEG